MESFSNLTEGIEMKNRDNLFYFLFSGIFMIVGMAMLIAGIVILVINGRFMERAEEVTAVITDIGSYRNSKGETSHKVLVEYTYAGKLYENAELNFYSSSMYEGKEISVFCDPDNPGHIRSNQGMTLLYGIFIGMGILFLTISAIVIGIALRKSSRRKRVRESGRKLYATVEEIALNTSLRMNGRHPYVIYCIWKDDCKDMFYRFKSDSI